MRLHRILIATVSIVGASTVPAIGRVEASSAAACTIGTTLREGATGPDVTCLETLLIATGAEGVIGPDDYFGPSTTQAVFIFQARHGLAIDGIVGAGTRAALMAAPPAGPPAKVPPTIRETRIIGTSVQGRPITAIHLGTPGGTVVMIVGIIHGDETKGERITELLRTMPIPAGVDLWLVNTMNPDGVANGTRGNANGVDLNRNFDVGWNYIPRSTTNHQYSGEAPDDQPETQAMESFIRIIQPTVSIWYHQDANVVSINGENHVLPTLYSKLVDEGTGSVPCTQLCTGTAGTFVNHTIAGSTSFLVELPGSATVTPRMIGRHASAVLAMLGG
ncbi:MAG: peptidase family protein [Ilumatobacteraceae bacterium]|nr:peptidase family protein [Ilumatobacteraceae bacterium]